MIKDYKIQKYFECHKNVSKSYTVCFGSLDCHVSTNVTYLKAPVTVTTMELEVSVIFYVLECREVLSEGASRTPEIKSPIGHMWFMYCLLNEP